MLLYTNMNKDKTTESVNEGEQRYKRIRAADIKRHGYTELAGRNDPKRAAVVKANTRKIARDRRLAGIVPGSANARPENRSDVLIHSARMSGEKRAAGKPSPRIPRKNTNRKLADSFNHGLEEGRIKRKDVRFINSNKVSTHDQVSRSNRMGLRHNIVRRNDVRDAQHFSFGGQTGFGRGFIDDRKRAAGKPSPRIAPKNRNRTIADSFNHGLEEAKRPTTPKRSIKQSKNIFGAAARGAISGMQTPKPAGTSGTKHVLKHAVRNMARHVMDKFL